MDFTGGITISGGVTIVPVIPASGNKAIFGYGINLGTSAIYSLTNLVSNAGVVATDTTGVDTPATANFLSVAIFKIP